MFGSENVRHDKFFIAVSFAVWQKVITFVAKWLSFFYP